jgi:hypothetical protein
MQLHDCFYTGSGTSRAGRRRHPKAHPADPVPTKGRGTRSCRLLTGARHASPRSNPARDCTVAAELTAGHGDHHRSSRGSAGMRWGATRSDLHRQGLAAPARPAGRSTGRGTSQACQGVGGNQPAARRVPAVHKSSARTGLALRTAGRAGLIDGSGTEFRRPGGPKVRGPASARRRTRGHRPWADQRQVW